MKKHLNILKSVELFKGIDESNILPLLSCLSGRLFAYGRNQPVLSDSESIHSFGIVLSGQLQIVQEDYYGNRAIISKVGVGQLFGESFACSKIKPLTVNVVATIESQILFIDSRKLAAPCEKACSFHRCLIQNMLNIIAKKNISLTQKIEFISKRTTRERLLSYLLHESKKAGANCFSIPFDRQELADYLFVDRSAMSAVLSKLRDEGVLNFNKNRFELL
ncbi:MAG: Crp/Fnr family transcriptional regulator [Clostridium sp.]|nr:Crp/Fnr family transcriptional regulator [Clostridium sp.]